MRGTTRAAAGVPAVVPHRVSVPGRDERGAPAAAAARPPRCVLARQAGIGLGTAADPGTPAGGAFRAAFTGGGSSLGGTGSRGAGPGRTADAFTRARGADPHAAPFANGHGARSAGPGSDAPHGPAATAAGPGAPGVRTAVARADARVPRPDGGGAGARRQAHRAAPDGCPRTTRGAGSTARGSAGGRLRAPGSFPGEDRAAVPGGYHRPGSARGALAAELRQGRS
ncbi:hypothetical protein [Streptomyces sp. NPDC020983]|uniref:hypothetical protein n=1 Tax=Streptomyces sp. NPDC020983 TaxID=3365106 RepID=UPI003795D83F